MDKGFKHGIKGVTLIELIIAISMFALVIALAGSLFFSGFKGYVQSSERIAGQSGVRLAIFEINNKLRLADPASVSVNEAGTSLVIGETVYSFTKEPSAEYGIITKIEDGNSRLVANNIIYFQVSMQADTNIITLKAESKWSDSYVETNISLGAIPTPTPTP